MRNVFKRGKYRLSEKVKVYLKFRALFTFFILLFLIVAVKLFFIFFDIPYLNNYYILLTILAVILVGEYFLYKLKIYNYNNYSYEYSTIQIIVTEGIIFKRKSVLPYNIIQDVILEKGPILQKYKLVNIRITALNSVLKIKMIDEKTATKIKEEILAKRSLYSVEY